MAKVSQYEADRVYEQLKGIVDNCIKYEAWEEYKGKALLVAQLIKKMKNYLENLFLYSKWDEKVEREMEIFEAAYYKMIYYKDLWASTDWILYTLKDYSFNDAKRLPRTFTFKDVNAFVESLLSYNLIKTYKGQISKIINANINGKQLLAMFDHVRTLTDNFKNVLDDEYLTNKLYKMNEGFYNPFDVEKTTIIDNKRQNDIEERIIRKIKVYNSKNQEGGIKYKNNGVYANTTFYKDDIIEEAPVYMLHDSDLYSANVRKLTFMIDDSKRLFGIPMGMATVARCAKESNKEGNIDYEFDPNNGNKIIIYATKKIRRGEELIFEEDNMCESDNVYDICSAPIDMIRSVEPNTTGVSNRDSIHTGVPYKAMV